MLPRKIDLLDFNRKDTQPSLAMEKPDGNSYFCPWLEDSITVHSDGNVSCGLDDPHALRSFGNIKDKSVQTIWANPEYRQLVEKLDDGYRCRDCKLYQRKPTDARRERRSSPNTLIVEPTVVCNIHCVNDVCAINNDSGRKTRDEKTLSYEDFRNVVDEIYSVLEHVYFFNYGDPFVNPWAEDMLSYLRERRPQVKIVTSTNGIPLAKPARAEKVTLSAPNIFVFTIGGVEQGSYEKYHARGRVDKALAGLRNVCSARASHKIENMQIIWRYLLFNWNDSDSEVEKALALAKDFGVDVFQLYLTHLPAGGASYHFAPGTPNFAKYRQHIDSALGYERHSGITYPDDDGFYDLEEDVSGLGAARWTSWRARLSSSDYGGRIRMALTTNRPRAKESSTYIYVVTPWKTYKFSVRHMHWTHVSIRIPRGYRNAHGPDRQKDVLLVCPEHWFPADDVASGDTRCLGVLMKAGRPSRFPAVSRSETSMSKVDVDLVSELLSWTTGFHDNANSGRTNF